MKEGYGMDDKKLFAIWQDKTVRGYITLTEAQRAEINALHDAGMYIGHDTFTNPEMFASQS